jgi:hypothetical protein
LLISPASTPFRMNSPAQDAADIPANIGPNLIFGNFGLPSSLAFERLLFPPLIVIAYEYNDLRQHRLVQRLAQLLSDAVSVHSAYTPFR